MNLQTVKASIELYLSHGCKLGGCLEAILRNDLCGSFARADEETRVKMFDIVSYVYNEVPMGARGEHVEQWLSDESYRKGIMDARAAIKSGACEEIK